MATVALRKARGWAAGAVHGKGGEGMERALLAIRLMLGARCVLPAFLLASVVLTFPVKSPAQERSSSDLVETYVTPFPDNESYRIVVLGDSLADGVWAGLVQAFGDDPQIEVLKKTDAANGLTRSDGTTWDQIVAALGPAEVPHVAVVVLGISDRRSLRVEGSKLEVGSDGWIAEYGKRVDAVLKALKRRNAAVYWIGLPIMRGNNTRRDTEIMNNVFRERALLNGTKFIATWDGFADPAGNYTDYGPDLTGKEQQLRDADGVHMTLRGYEKLAHFAEQEIRRDIALARSERDVPLAGDAQEQQQVARQARIASGSAGGEADQLAAEKAEADDVPAASSSITFGDNETIEIVRPKVPGIVLAHLQRSAPSRPALVGRTVSSDLRGGLTALSSIASASDQVVSGGKARVPLSQSPYYKVLIKGEPLPSKPGRADDFSWPKTGVTLTE